MDEQKPWYRSESFLLVLIILVPPIAFFYLLTLRKQMNVSLELLISAGLTILWALRFLVPLTDMQFRLGAALIVLVPFFIAILMRRNTTEN